MKTCHHAGFVYFCFLTSEIFENSYFTFLCSVRKHMFLKNPTVPREIFLKIRLKIMTGILVNCDTNQRNQPSQTNTHGAYQKLIGFGKKSEQEGYSILFLKG
jgi:hypothetical protein